MFEFLKNLKLPIWSSSERVQEPIKKRKRKETTENLAMNNNQKKVKNEQLQLSGLSSTHPRTITTSATEKQKSTPSEEIMGLIISEEKKEYQKKISQASENGIQITSHHNRKKLQQRKTDLTTHSKELRQPQVIDLENDDDEIAREYKSLDLSYVKTHSESIHPQPSKYTSESVKTVPHIPVETPSISVKTTQNKQVPPPVIRLGPPKLVSKSSKHQAKVEEDATLLDHDSVERVTKGLQSLLTLRDKVEEAKVTKSFIERVTMKRASSKILTRLCEELLTEEAKKVYDTFLPQKIYDKLLSEIISGTIETEKEFFPLSKKDEALVNKIFSHRNTNRDEILAEKYKIDITWQKIQCLKNTDWLNDEVINFYLNMVKDRNDKYPEKYPKIYVFNTFFYAKLTERHSYNYGNVRRWTRKIDLLEYDKIIIPIHLTVHWTLAVINIRDERFEYYDSMDGVQTGMNVLQNLQKYLSDEVLDKKQVSFDTMSWRKYVPHTPQQENGSDCGMFTCKFANFIAQDKPLTFSQKHMPYFRRRMVVEIVRSKEIL
ncbi:hypothetical protein C9374_006676 [Naegleria lovaniensis]|uniref:Ubiquitin-like protease family profile domain-containing protein n=1 Tax=Naegleria lovaniensis TaxID=51637 RepID=A0AA88KM54_NAELO|nr:uncharacterized protein C9374_006676 [Naegleria lovaniensis]KAG2379559.1 hypothetical protein C9374_006676 [Naegleria lovaniensis]